MLGLRDSVWKFLEEAPSIGSPRALDDAFRRTIAEFSFNRYDCRLLTRRPEGPAVKVLSDGGLTAWNDHYVRTGLLNNDPCMEYGRSGTHGMRPAFSWSDVHEIMPQGSGEAMWSEARSDGMREGFVVSTRVGLNDFLCVRMIGDEVGIDPSARSLLQVMAMVYGHQHRQLAPPEPKPGAVLTPRERECLEWAAQGKTDIEIGMILNMSRHTVQTHIEKAKTKLGVATRMQAAIQAIKLGEMAIP